jgi:hypothetical protein
MVVGSEAYAAALVAYRYAKEANLGAGLDGVLDNIGRRFARKSIDTPRAKATGILTST